MKKIFIILILLFISNNINAQDPELLMEYLIEDDDTLFIDYIAPVIIRNDPPRGRKGREWRRQYRLVHNFSKSYPYALLAKEEINQADEYMAEQVLNPRQREIFLSNLQGELFDIFEEPLKNLTFTQGRLLLRLADREIGLSSYAIIKSYRGRIAAGFWQGIARMFGANMKKPYDKFNEDKELERLVLIYQKGDFNYLYYSIFGKFPPEPVTKPRNDFPQKLKAPRKERLSPSKTR